MCQDMCIMTALLLLVHQKFWSDTILVISSKELQDCTQSTQLNGCPRLQHSLTSCMPEWVVCMQAKLATAAAAHAEFPHSSGSTNSSSAPELTSVPIGPWSPADGMAAQPWDLDPAEITICKRPDGLDWILGVGSFGQVCQILVKLPCITCTLKQFLLSP